jgi:diphthamide synthase (EF-2-diphthine--ammonia ligase)
LPVGIDPCGERGEFHTFVQDGPCFAHSIECHTGEVVLRESRFAYCDILPDNQKPKSPNSR